MVYDQVFLTKVVRVKGLVTLLRGGRGGLGVVC